MRLSSRTQLLLAALLSLLSIAWLVHAVVVNITPPADSLEPPPGVAVPAAPQTRASPKAKAAPPAPPKEPTAEPKIAAAAEAAPPVERKVDSEAKPVAEPRRRIVRAASRPPPEESPTPSPAAAASDDAVPETAPPAARAESKPGPSGKARPGRLSLVTRPETEVFLGQTSLGNTPLVGVELPPGHQVLQLVNEDKGISQSFEVEIRAGETTQKRLDLAP
jgi:hypothetical protein